MKLTNYIFTKFLFFALIVLSFVSCQEKNENNSKYSSFIKEIKNAKTKVDTLYRDFENINIDSLYQVYTLANKKHKEANKVKPIDSCVISFQNELKIFKGLLIKKLEPAKRNHHAILNEYSYSNNQVSSLIDNLINETFNEDSAQIFYNKELEALFILEKEIVNYNSIANNTFIIKDSLNKNLDSLINIYTK